MTDDPRTSPRRYYASAARLYTVVALAAGAAFYFYRTSGFRWLAALIGLICLARAARYALRSYYAPPDPPPESILPPIPPRTKPTPGFPRLAQLDPPDDTNDDPPEPSRRPPQGPPP